MITWNNVPSEKHSQVNAELLRLQTPGRKSLWLLHLSCCMC